MAARMKALARKILCGPLSGICSPVYSIVSILEYKYFNYKWSGSI